MDLDLVHGRHHGSTVEQGGEVVDHEVADPDRSHLPVGEQRLQGAVGLQGRLELRGQRLVQDEQVDLVDAELAGALLEPVQGLVVAVVADPDLGLQEHLGPVQVRLRDCFPDLPLVAIRGGGVDVAVAGLQGRRDRIPGLIGRSLEHAKTEGGQGDVVVQRQGGNVRHG